MLQSLLPIAMKDGSAKQKLECSQMYVLLPKPKEKVRKRNLVNIVREFFTRCLLMRPIPTISSKVTVPRSILNLAHELIDNGFEWVRSTGLFVEMAPVFSLEHKEFPTVEKLFARIAKKYLPRQINVDSDPYNMENWDSLAQEILPSDSAATIDVNVKDQQKEDPPSDNDALMADKVTLYRIFKQLTYAKKNVV